MEVFAELISYFLLFFKKYLIDDVIVLEVSEKLLSGDSFLAEFQIKLDVLLDFLGRCVHILCSRDSNISKITHNVKTNNSDLHPSKGLLEIH